MERGGIVEKKSKTSPKRTTNFCLHPKSPISIAHNVHRQPVQHCNYTKSPQFGIRKSEKLEFGIRKSMGLVRKATSDADQWLVASSSKQYTLPATFQRFANSPSLNRRKGYLDPVVSFLSCVSWEGPGPHPNANPSPGNSQPSPLRDY